MAMVRWECPGYTQVQPRTCPGFRFPVPGALLLARAALGLLREPELWAARSCSACVPGGRRCAPLKAGHARPPRPSTQARSVATDSAQEGPASLEPAGLHTTRLPGMASLHHFDTTL